MEQSKQTSVFDLFKATWRKALKILVTLLLVSGVTLFVTFIVITLCPGAGIFKTGAIVTLFTTFVTLVIPILVLAYIIFLLVKAKRG